MTLKTQLKSRRSFLQIAILAAIGILFAYLFWTAFVLKIDYFDCFGIFLNSKSIAAGDGSTYHWRRSPVVPLLLSPFFFTERLLSIERFGFVASHLLGVCLFAACLVFFYRTARLTLERLWALGGTFLLCLNGLMLHYALSAKEDIPGTLFVTAAFYFYLRSTSDPSRRYRLLTSVFIALTIATRFNLIPLMFAVIAAHELWSGNTRLVDLIKPDSAAARRAFWVKVGWFLIVPSVIFFLIPTILYPFLGIDSVFHAPRKFVDELFLQYALTTAFQTPVQNYTFLLYSCTVPVLLVALLGLITSVRQKVAGTRLAILWLGIFFLFHTYWIGAKEARYLLPLYPAIYLFAARGLEYAVDRLGRIGSPPVRRWAPVVLVVVFVFPVKQVVRQVIRLRDPVYTTDYQRQVSLYARELAGEGRIYWVGPFYPVHPRDYLFHPEDEFTCLYHLYTHVIQFHARVPVQTIEVSQLIKSDSDQGPVFPGPNIARFVDDGDVLIVNLEPEGYITKNVPQDVQPLVVQRVRQLPFLPASETGDGAAIFVSRELTGARIQAQLTSAGFTVRGTGIPDGHYEIVLQPSDSEVSVSFAVVTTQDSGFHSVHRGLRQDADLSRITLLTYDAVKRFAVPRAHTDERADL